MAEDNPDLIVYASRNRLHVSTNGGVFWRALAVELPRSRRSRSRLPRTWLGHVRGLTPDCGSPPRR